MNDTKQTAICQKFDRTLAKMLSTFLRDNFFWPQCSHFQIFFENLETSAEIGNCKKKVDIR